MKCSVSHCDNILKSASRMPTCTACRSAFRYWQKPEKGPVAIMARHRQLLKWTDRCIMLSTEVKGAFAPVGPKMKRELRKY